MCHSSSADRSAGSSCSSFCASVVFPEQGSPTIKWRVATLLTPKGHLEAAERLRAERRHRAAAYMKSRRGGVRSSEGLGGSHLCSGVAGILAVPIKRCADRLRMGCSNRPECAFVLPIVHNE